MSSFERHKVHDWEALDNAFVCPDCGGPLHAMEHGERDPTGHDRWKGIVLYCTAAIGAAGWPTGTPPDERTMPVGDLHRSVVGWSVVGGVLCWTPLGGAYVERAAAREGEPSFGHDGLLYDGVVPDDCAVGA